LTFSQVGAMIDAPVFTLRKTRQVAPPECGASLCPEVPMPGSTVRRPRVYNALRRKGLSKKRAAAISNAGTTKAKRSRMAKKAARTRRSRGRR
jgi:hypothetical protein